MSDSIEAGSDEIPDVLRTLAALLPQFTGDDLEAQLQTYDAFLGVLSPVARPKIAALLRDAAAKTTDVTARARIELAANLVETGGPAAPSYDHAEAMEECTKAFKESYADVPPVVAATSAATQSGEKRKHPKLLAQLDKIEAEMKKIGYWSDNPPDLLAAAERGELKSFLDAPTFELWLQALFIPRARQAATDDELPAGSQVGEMARRQYDYMSVDDKAEKLLRLLQEFDDLVDFANHGAT